MVQRDSIALGFLLQKAICDENDIILTEKDKNFFKRYENEQLEEKARVIARKIRKLLPNNIKPKQYVSCVNGDVNINFYLTYGKTMSVRITSNGLVPPRTLGQAGVKVARYYYSNLLNEEINTGDDLKKIYIRPQNTIKLIPLWIEKLLWCDYNFYVIKEKNIKLIKKFEGAFELEEKYVKITSSQTYPSISYDGISLVQPGYTRATPNVRINVKNVERFIKLYGKSSEKSTRWNYGDATERAICDIYKLKNAPKADMELVSRIKPYIKKIFDEKEVIVDEFVGGLKTEEKIAKKITETNNDKILLGLIEGFGKELHSPMDFYADKKSISVKSTKLTNGLVCPDTIGQPSGETRCKLVLDKIFIKTIPEYGGHINPGIFVDIVYSPENLIDMLRNYMQYLFACDYLFYLNGNNNNAPLCNMYRRDEEGKWAENISWDKRSIKYVKAIDEVKNALKKNSNSGHGVIPIDYKQYRLGQFDIHKRKKNYIYQFRFKFRELIDFLVSENIK